MWPAQVAPIDHTPIALNKQGTAFAYKKTQFETIPNSKILYLFVV
jgi:hypothetical protein